MGTTRIIRKLVMHIQALPEMKKNLELFAPEVFLDSSLVLDVGSLDVKHKGNYRVLFEPNAKTKYIGCDLIAGPNVDVVIETENVFPWPNNTFNFVISGQTIEHCSNPFRFVSECARVLKPKGKLFITGPSSGVMHHPPDRWRISPYGMTTLFECAGLKILKVYMDTDSEYWLDCWGIGEK